MYKNIVDLYVSKYTSKEQGIKNLKVVSRGSYITQKSFIWKTWENGEDKFIRVEDRELNLKVASGIILRDDFRFVIF